MDESATREKFWSRRSWAYITVGVLGLPIGFVLHEGFFENAVPSARYAQPAIAATVAFLAVAVVLLARYLPLTGQQAVRRGLMTSGVGFLAGSIVVGGAFLGVGLAMDGFHCGYTPSDAFWVEPGLYDSFPEPSDDARVRISQFVPKGLPFKDPDLEAIARGAALTEIQFWLPDAEGRSYGPTSITLDDSLQLRFHADDRWTRQELDHRYQQFMANVSLADSTQWSNWSDALFSDGQPADIATWTLDEDGEWVDVTYTVYTTSITGPFRLEDFGSQFRNRDTMEWKYGTRWVYEFEVPEKSLLLKHEGIELVVDSTDQVEVNGVYSEMSGEDYLGRLENDLSPFLQLNMLHTATVEGSVC